MENQLFPDNANPSSSDKCDNYQSDETIISQHKIKEYVDDKKELYNNLLTFLEGSEPFNFKNVCQKLIYPINLQMEKESRDNFEHFLHLIADISNNIHRDDSIFKKIFQILNYYHDQIKKNFTNTEIFNIFQSNKLILLFLFENKILTVDDQIYLELIDKREVNGSRYCHFFYPEIKEYAGEDEIQSIKDELLSQNPDILNYLEERRKIGQNDTYITKLIREDSIEEFIPYVNKNDISIEIQIKPSLFETNLFLIENQPTIIEYSAFFGSIQIFKYIISQNVELKPSIWLYAIHSRNPELIVFLEQKKIQPPNDLQSKDDDDYNYDACFIESIKCHHNEIADYIFENFIATNYDVSKQREKFLSNILQYHNYKYFPSNFIMGYDLYYLSFFNYQTIVDLFIKSKEKEIVSMLLTESTSLFDNLFNASINGQIEVIYYLLMKQTKIIDEYFGCSSILNTIAIPPSIVSIEKDGFKNCSHLKQITIPSSVTSIGDNAFSNCSELTQIKIPSSVISIGNGAFSDCSKLKQIIIPSSVTSIANNTYNGCANLMQVLIPSSITSIGDNAFSNCSELTEIIIPTSVTSIGKKAFEYCSKVTQITIPSSVTSIGDNAFSNCSELTQIKIPSSVISIGNGAFSDCSKLKQIIIPSSVTSIANNTFNGCANLMQVIIPSSITSIGDNAFSNCSELTEIIIPTSVTSIGKKVFEYCSKVTQITIPSSVTSIGKGAFCHCINLAKFVILASITSISIHLLRGCENLKEIILPSSVTSIGDYAFSYCSKLAHITLPPSLTSIGNYSFFLCYSLEEIVIPSSLTSIGNGAFCECSILREITIPPSVTSIGKFAFCECTLLNQVSFPSSITSIEDFVFRKCTSLTKFSIQSSVTSIGNGAFCGCSSLTEILIPDSVTSIGDYAFNDCSSLTEISIPDSISLIKKGTFSCCSSLTKIKIPSSVTSIGSCAFYKCSSLTQFSIPSKITSLESCLFYKCESLTKVEIPSSVTKIGIMSFYGCSSLVDLSIPESVTDIGKYAFLNCSSLKSVKPSLTEMEPFINVDDYEIKEMIGRGGFAQVLRAVNKRTGQEFALKCYSESDIGSVDDFLDGVAISTMKGVAKIHSFRFPLSEEEKTRVKTLEIRLNYNNKEITVDLTGYIVISELMKYNNVREDVTKYLKEKKVVDGIINPTNRSKIIFGVASIMKHLHEQNMINRNLKLESIFLDENYEPCINCCILSTFISNPNLTKAVGTPYCMAPETFLECTYIYTLTVDVFSYAILLYVMFSCRIQFDDHKPIRSNQQYMMRIARGNRPKKPENIPDHYWELIQKCWQNDPDNRPTFAEITNLLKDDKYALEEFGVKTDLEQLHEYQQRIDKD